MKPRLGYLIREESVSPPMRGRGLKRRWKSEMGCAFLSPPMRGRGLKPRIMLECPVYVPSPPMRGRGLKRHIPPPRCGGGKVAPHAGAWIETVPICILQPRQGRRPPCGGVD